MSTPTPPPGFVPDPDPESFKGVMVERAHLPVMSEKGNPIHCLENAVHVLTNDAQIKGVIALDTFSMRVVKLAAPPYFGGRAGEWTDEDERELSLWLSRIYGLRMRKEDLQNAVLVAARRHEFNEVVDYLNGLKWDGKRRLHKWLSYYLNADDGCPEEVPAERYMKYLRLVSIKTLVAAVARVYEPGCKVDTMTVLEGAQGLGKSTTWKILGGRWFTDAYLDLNSKEPYAILRGKWFVEWSELESLTRADRSTVKRFLSTDNDRYRSWYGTHAADVPRTCVFVGSVNESNYLSDLENRRFWPVYCSTVKIAELKEDRDQLWAEAVRFYRRRFPWHQRQDRPRERALFEEQQERRYAYDSIEDPIRLWLEGDPGAGVRYEVTIAEVLQSALSLRSDRWTQQEQRRVAGVLKRLGYQRKQVRGAEGDWKSRGWKWIKPKPAVTSPPKRPTE